MFKKSNLASPSTIYIAGRMHCGSTFLNVLLGSSPFVEGLGELVNGISRGPGELCSCGEPISACPFWSQVADVFEEYSGENLFESASWLRRHSDIRNFFSAYFAKVTVTEAPQKKGDNKKQNIWQKYARLNTILVKSISNVAQKPLIIDSSKEFTRGLITLKSNPNARLIHLVRNPVATVGSYYWRQTKGSRFYFMQRSYDIKWLRFPALMLVAASWTVGLVAAILIQIRFPSRVLHISYEQFCTDPRGELKRIGSFVENDLSDIIEGIEKRHAFPMGHNLAGNTESKRAGTFVFTPNIKGRRKIPFLYFISSTIFASPGLIIRWFLSKCGFLPLR